MAMALTPTALSRDDSDVLRELKERIEGLEKSYKTLTSMISFKKSSIMSKMSTLNERVSKLEKRTLTVKRKQFTFPVLKMSTYANYNKITRSIPKDVLPVTTGAVIVSIKCERWTSVAKLGLKIRQSGNKEGGWVEYTSPMNDFYYETLVPWDSKMGNKITFRPTGSSPSWYTIGIVGYVTL